MSRQSVLNLVSSLAPRADASMLDGYYDDALFELGRIGQTLQIAVLTTDQDSANYAAPDDSIRILSVFYDNLQLYNASIRDIEAHSSSWRDRKGTPLDYVTEFETENAFRLYPTPDVPGKPFIWTGNTFGTDYPEYASAVVYQQKRSEVADYFDLYLTMTLLEREFSRESDHRDLAYARVCGQLAGLFLRMVL